MVIRIDSINPVKYSHSLCLLSFQVVFFFLKHTLRILPSHASLSKSGDTHAQYFVVDIFTAPFNNMRTPKFKGQQTNAVFRYRQSNVRRLLQASDHCRAYSNQIKSLSTLRQYSRKLGGAAEHLIDGSEKRICRLSFEF